MRLRRRSARIGTRGRSKGNALGRGWGQGVRVISVSPGGRRGIGPRLRGPRREPASTMGGANPRHVVCAMINSPARVAARPIFHKQLKWATATTPRRNAHQSRAAGAATRVGRSIGMSRDPSGEAAAHTHVGGEACAERAVRARDDDGADSGVGRGLLQPLGQSGPGFEPPPLPHDPHWPGQLGATSSENGAQSCRALPRGLHG